MLDHEGKEVPGNRGYKYFGAAKELPGVKELFEQVCLQESVGNVKDLAPSLDDIMVYISIYSVINIQKPNLNRKYMPCLAY